MIPAKVYCDGGVIGRNPSTIGGTWAYVWIDADDNQIKQGSGVVTPDDLGLTYLTNNITELLAALRGLQGLPKLWSGTLHTDSLVTQARLIQARSFTNIPNRLRLLTREIRRELRYKVELVGGHPTKQELLDGKLRRNGFPTSKWNVFCDKECTRLCKSFLAAHSSR